MKILSTAGKTGLPSLEKIYQHAIVAAMFLSLHGDQRRLIKIIPILAAPNIKICQFL